MKTTKSQTTMEKSRKNGKETLDFCHQHENCDYFCSVIEKTTENYGNSNQGDTDALRGGSPSFPRHGG